MILLVQNLSFDYPQRPLFSDWSAQIPPGVTLLCGGESTGKSSLLRLLAAQLPALAGHLQINGISLDEQPDAYRQQVFWADVHSEEFEQITPAAYFHSRQQLYPHFDSALLATLTGAFLLTPHMDKAMYMLSTGSKRKVWLAAAFASGAAVTLLDEPFAALDKTSVSVLLKLLQAAAADTERAYVVAHYEALGATPLASIIDLGG